MAKTKLNTAIQAVKELRAIRAKLEPLQKREKELKDYVKSYLLEHGGSLNTAECTAIIRKTPKFRLENENEALNMAIMLHLPCLKVDGKKFADSLIEIDSNTDLSLYGENYDDIAVRITYRKK